jgi:DNA-binding NarL/FixJ family response regulator
VVKRPRDLRFRPLRSDVVMLTFARPRPRLTDAQRDVAIHIVSGSSNAAIALARGVSVRTVANQVAALLRKMGVTSRTELAAHFSVTDLLRM